MKPVLIILVLVLGYLFYPFRDLYVKEDVFAEDFILVHQGYWSESSCVDAAMAQAAELFSCHKRSVWSRMFSTYTQYSPTIRDIRSGRKVD